MPTNNVTGHLLARLEVFVRLTVLGISSLDRHSCEFTTKLEKTEKIAYFFVLSFYILFLLLSIQKYYWNIIIIVQHYKEKRKKGNLMDCRFEIFVDLNNVLTINYGRNERGEGLLPDDHMQMYR